MDLISCNKCAVVLDLRKIKKDEKEEFVWDGKEYVSWITCPVCRQKIYLGQE